MNRPTILMCLKKRPDDYRDPEYREADDAVDAREDWLKANDKVLKRLRRRRDAIQRRVHKKYEAQDKERKELLAKFVTAAKPSRALMRRIERYLIAHA